MDDDDDDDCTSSQDHSRVTSDSDVCEVKLVMQMNLVNAAPCCRYMSYDNRQRNGIRGELCGHILISYLNEGGGEGEKAYPIWIYKVFDVSEYLTGDVNLALYADIVFRERVATIRLHTHKSDLSLPPSLFLPPNKKPYQYQLGRLFSCALKNLSVTMCENI